MTTDNLLFTLTFDQLERQYRGTVLSHLEQELFSRIKEMKLTHENELMVLDDTIYNLKETISVLKEELIEKYEEIDNLKCELKSPTLNFKEY